MQTARHSNSSAPAAGSRVYEAREEGYYWVVLGRKPPETYWERGEWWLAADATPWQQEAVTVVSERLAFRPQLVPVA
jgi:hypothetical protein